MRSEGVEEHPDHIEKTAISSNNRNRQNKIPDVRDDQRGKAARSFYHNPAAQPASRKYETRVLEDKISSFIAKELLNLLTRNPSLRQTSAYGKNPRRKELRGFKLSVRRAGVRDAFPHKTAQTPGEFRNASAACLRDHLQRIAMPWMAGRVRSTT